MLSGWASTCGTSSIVPKIDPPDLSTHVSIGANAPIACSVDPGRTIYDAEPHPGVGGAGTAACSGDLLLGALAACAQLTCQMVAASMEIALESVEVTVEGDLDLAGTLGTSREAPVGFEAIRLAFAIDAPEASEAELVSLREKTERYCVVLQTLNDPPRIEARSSPLSDRLP